MEFGLLPTAGVSVTACGFVDAKGSVGIMMSRRLVFACMVLIVHLSSSVFDAPDSSCLSRVSAELRGCNRKRFSSAALFKKEEDPVIQGGRVGPHCRDCGVEQSAAV